MPLCKQPPTRNAIAVHANNSSTEHSQLLLHVFIPEKGGATQQQHVIKKGRTASRHGGVSGSTTLLTCAEPHTVCINVVGIKHAISMHVTFGVHSPATGDRARTGDVKHGAWYVQSPIATKAAATKARTQGSKGNKK